MQHTNLEEFLAVKLKQLRNAKGWTQTEAAMELRFKQSTYSDIESGKKQHTLSQWDEYFKALGSDVGIYLLEYLTRFFRETSILENFRGHELDHIRHMTEDLLRHINAM